MRGEADAGKVRMFLRELSRRARGPGSVYVTGGATAALLGWRDQTIDIDLKLDPEPAGAFEAIARLKDELDVNVKLASPDLFTPTLPDWRQRSPAIDVSGSVKFFHYDLRGQALAKIERGHARDLADVSAMLERKLLTVAELEHAFETIEPALLRYPAARSCAMACATSHRGSTACLRCSCALPRLASHGSASRSPRRARRPGRAARGPTPR